LVKARLEDGGDHVLGTGGTEHLKLLLNDLADHAPGVKVAIGEPTVSYRETCTFMSVPPFGKDTGCLSKSPNKHNRLFCNCEPNTDEACQIMEEGKVNMQQDYKKRAKIMKLEGGWDQAEAMKIWGFAPVGAELPGTCVLVDATKGVQYLNEIKEYTNSGLYWACREGPIAEEPIRGTRFNLMDVKLHSDSVHRGMGQIQPTARRVFYACLLTAGPRMTEPIYCVIACPGDQAAGARQAINAKRGELIQENNADEAGRRVNIEAYIPIAETIGGDAFAKVVSQKTQGKAFVNYAFDHWKIIESDPMDVGSKANKLMLEIRERKGAKVEPPKLGDYLDKL
jgi:elongation factor 2